MRYLSKAHYSQGENIRIKLQDRVNGLTDSVMRSKLSGHPTKNDLYTAELLYT